MAEARVTAGAGRFAEYRELILGVVFSIVLGALAFLFQSVALIGTDLRAFAVVAFAGAGLLFGVVLWAGSRRERDVRRVQQAIASVNTGGVVVDDKDGRIVFANAKMCEMVGLRGKEIIGKNFTDIIAPDSRQLADAEFVRRRLGASSMYEIQLSHADGSELTALVSSQSLMSHDKYRGSAAFVLDITARKASEREVTQAKELAEFFLDLITHDISNVNQGVRGYSEILSTVPDMPAKQRQGYITKILSQIDRANALITNIKKISELRWAWREAPTGTIDVEESIRQAIAMAMSSFASRQVEVSFVNRAGRLAAKGDYLATELFYNLLHNAIKYTPGPSADVAVEVDRGAGGTPVVRVIDHGPGIPDAAKGQMFARISPGNRERAPSGYHSGTGLTLVRLISERFGWRVWVEDRVAGDSSKGAAFCVEVPPAERAGAG